jgi:hypothetical protein
MITATLKHENISVKLCQKLLSFLSNEIEKAITGLGDVFGMHFHGRNSGNNSENSSLKTWDNVGASIVSKYGSRILPNIDPEISEASLKKLLLFVNNKIYFHNPDEFHGFDWFLSTLFLIMETDVSKTSDFLTILAKTTSSLFIWPTFGRSLEISIKKDYNVSCLSATGCQWVEAIVQVHHPMILSAFTMNGCSVTQVISFYNLQLVLRWIRECFWNILDFQEILHYILICTCFGPDYQIYFCVALINHVRTTLLASARDQTLIYFINSNSIADGFKAGDYIEFMHKLAKQHQTDILSDINQKLHKI